MTVKSRTRVRAQPLDRQIRQVLLDQILTGKLPPGANLTEARLAAELGASRTPLRNALVRLQHDGFIVVEPNRGFFVAPLTSEEANDLYPMLACLEQLALRLAPPLASDLVRLKRINERLVQAISDGAQTIAALNFEWHEQLLRRCQNRRLLAMIENLRRQVHRYELAFFLPGAGRVRKSVDLHDWIIEALENGEVAEATRRLDVHWATDLDTIVPSARAPAT